MKKAAFLAAFLLYLKRSFGIHKGFGHLAWLCFSFSAIAGVLIGFSSPDVTCFSSGLPAQPSKVSASVTRKITFFIVLPMYL